MTISRRGFAFLCAFIFMACVTRLNAQEIHHDIFLTLKDTSAASVQKQVALGKKYLSGHPGQLSLTATVIAKGLTRHQQVSYLHNDEDFQVSFHFVFKDAQSHDVYQVSERHKTFIKESNPNWKKVRVFDTQIAP